MPPISESMFLTFSLTTASSALLLMLLLTASRLMSLLRRLSSAAVLNPIPLRMLSTLDSTLSLPAPERYSLRMAWPLSLLSMALRYSEAL